MISDVICLLTNKKSVGNSLMKSITFKKAIFWAFSLIVFLSTIKGFSTTANSCALFNMSTEAKEKDLVFEEGITPTLNGLSGTAFKNTGKMNSGIFTVDKNGKTIIYKIFQLPQEYFNSIVQGNKLGMPFGSPQLFAFGPIVNEKGNKYANFYYLEMEFLFPDATSYTYKDHGFSKISGSPSTLFREIAQSIIELAKANVVPDDLDIIYTSKNEWRWIDTDLWRKGTPKQVAAASSLILNKMTIEQVNEFLPILKKEIAVLSPEIQNEFIAIFKIK